MKSAKIRKKPLYKNTIEPNGLRAYLRNFSLLLTRFKWATEDNNRRLDVKNIQKYVSNLIDPVAFNTGETTQVSNIKKSIKNINNSLLHPIYIKVEIMKTGRTSSIITSRKDSQIVTTIADDTISTLDDTHSIEFPPNKNSWFESHMKVEEWHHAFNKSFSEPTTRDKFKIGFYPSDNSRFKFVCDFPEL